MRDAVTNKREHIRSIVLAALFTAIIAALAQVTIMLPGGIPITLQTFAIALCGYVLGCKWGMASLAVYLLTGAIGLPVYSGFGSGFGVLTGVTGGYLYGFIGLVLLCGLGKCRKPWISIPLGIAGIAVCHICGSLQFAAVSGNGLLAALLTASVPYLPKDIASIVAAYFLARQFERLMRKIFR